MQEFLMIASWLKSFMFSCYLLS